ncbi:hypothetical protein [Haliangium sp.]|uniref:hypothetical protein n=1 Tax=Haliangium sp. TaxID=2663208 RepID=UPI003D124783
MTLLLAATVACGGGDDGGGGPDATPPADTPDAAQGSPDAAPSAPDARISLSVCEGYCTTVMTNCTGANAQYADMGECVDLCQNAGWREGQPDDASGNSLNCRATHAGELAAADPGLHCPHAGPTGGGMCGSLCANYCFYTLNNCSADALPFDNVGACEDACTALYPDDGQLGDSSGNTLQCRLEYAIQAASDSDSTASCLAAHPAGSDTCGSWCEVYCHLMETNCSDQPSAYPDNATCLSTCAGFANDGSLSPDPSQAMGDTVQCRIDHAGLPALRSRVTECEIAAEFPSNNCVDVAGGL